MATSRKKRLGATIIELVVATGISVIVLGACVGIMCAGSASWATGLGHINADNSAQLAVRMIEKRLQEAMWVQVDPNGMGLSYQLPQTDDKGNYVLPLTWDGVNRRVQVENTNQLAFIDDNNSDVIAKGLIFTDPLSPSGTTPYEIFTPNSGATTNQVTVEVATQSYGHKTNGASTKVAARERETVFLRNIPQTTTQ